VDISGVVIGDMGLESREAERALHTVNKPQLDLVIMCSNQPGSSVNLSLIPCYPEWARRVLAVAV